SQQQINAGSYTFTNVQANHTIGVSSIVTPPKNYYITATSDSHSNISPSGVKTVVSHSNQTFTFSADAGYYISSVKINGVAQSQQVARQGYYTFTYVLMNHIIEVESTPIVIVATHDSHSTINTSGMMIQNGAASQTFTFSTDSGYCIESITVDGLTMYPDQQVTNGTWTFTNLNWNHTIDVKSIPIPVHHDSLLDKALKGLAVVGCAAVIVGLTVVVPYVALPYLAASGHVILATMGVVLLAEGAFFLFEAGLNIMSDGITDYIWSTYVA
ncbi:MAG: hypothetical protein FWG41_05925, partial [Methanomassiliicoccaceae archaeon]|nr:hypothetical protein [Methanomassiliicoccaceae archaeon]